ncbi:hypothetical protein [Bythopirellula polymerisocia]|uniref:Flagellar protein FliL n=1 Tax=Bythopirellula polymerisocia TaxID=2528003 RepID=A0A5C6D0S0_9BACT|nr:hypothetical protein [Bythopirellula polymerisocia]TWU30318.1 hypothetical protein Pla144_11040 [Bythopirellula polymerisocia]
MNTSLMINDKRIRFSKLLLCLLSIALGTSTAMGQEAPAEDQGASASQEATTENVVQPKLDLGIIEIKNLEPTRNQTSKVTFEMHLTLPADTDPALVAALGHWQHRLREQVIVAIRVAELGDYLDPELVRLRKQILYRVNRLLKGTQAENVLLADFTFSTE